MSIGYVAETTYFNSGEYLGTIYEISQNIHKNTGKFNITLRHREPGRVTNFAIIGDLALTNKPDNVKEMVLTLIENLE